MAVALRWNLIYVGLAAAWNTTGALLKAIDLPPLGPSGSLPLALVFLGVGAACAWSAPRWPIVPVLLSFLLAGVAGLSIANALRPDARDSLWIIPAARYAGVAINAFGLLAFGRAVVAYVRMRSSDRRDAAPERTNA